MTTQLLFYGNVNPINRQKHRDLYVKTGKDYSFAKEVNSVPLLAVEFPSAALEYPIVFAGEGDAILPSVLMGTSNKENLFLNADSKWQANYIPAFVRRYPFVFAASEENNQLTLCIDEEFVGCNSEGIGERLFDAEGVNTSYLSNVLSFMEEYQAHYHRTTTFCKKLTDLDLLEPMTAQFKMEGKDRSLSGFQGVKREKLKAISDNNLRELFDNDGLELLYLHLQSLNNVSQMAEKASSSKLQANEKVEEAIA